MSFIEGHINTFLIKYLKVDFYSNFIFVLT